MKTVLLDTVEWDLVIDASQNIAVASDPYSMSQDASSAARLFQGELYYDTTQGITYRTQILGKLPPLSLIKNQIVNAALSVPGVKRAACFFSSFSDRSLKGQLQLSDSNGPISTVNF